MSVTETAPPGGDFERTPPHDVAAEQCVLGGMLLSKDAISDVMEVIRPKDHYRPAHQLIHEGILELYGRGEPADAVTVADLLNKRGELVRVGGPAYLHTLIASVPTAANAGYYARIVRERAILRRLVEAGTRIVQLGYAGDGEADELVDRAEAEIYGVTDRRVSEDYLPLSEIMPGAIDEIEAIGSRGGIMTGVPTGFADLDALTNGLHPGQMVVIAARPALGKALALDTPLSTPTGWTTMGEVQVGDYLIGADGKPTRVIAATHVMIGRPCYEVEFDDGAVIVADAQHEWRTRTRARRRQDSEIKRALYWPDKAIRRVEQAYAASRAASDVLRTHRELVGPVGDEFANVLHTVANRVVTRGRVQRQASGPARRYLWSAPAYSKQELLGELLRHVKRPENAHSMAVHPSTVTTAEIAATVRAGPPGDRRLNHSVTVAAPLDLPDADLEVPPYALGVWLGDGASSGAGYASADPEIAMHLEAEGMCVTRRKARYSYALQFPRAKRYPVDRDCAVCGERFTPKNLEVTTCGRRCGGRLGHRGTRRSRPVCERCGTPCTGLLPGYGVCRECLSRYSFTGALRELGVLGNKHIPPTYLRASRAQRRRLLAGLLDTNGTVTADGSVQFSVTSKRLAEGFCELVTSLGYRCGWWEKPVRGRSAESSVAYIVTFTTEDDVFRLERKRSLHKERRAGRTTPRTRQRYITAVRAIPSVPVRCVQVDSEDHLYLAGRSMIPTHNSTLALDLARAAAVRHGMATVLFSLEMSRNEITMRLLSAEARVPLHAMRTGQMREEDWVVLVRRMSEVVDAPLFIDDSPNMSMMEIRAKCRRLKQRQNLRLVIIDYLQLMSSPRRVENRQQEVSEMSRSLKLLAKELDVPVVAISQLNRGPEQRNDKRPLLSDLRESGCLTAETRILRADTGIEVSLGDLLASGERDVPVWSLDERLRLIPSTLTHAFPSGTKEVFRVRLKSGREVDATANHPFLTYDGWCPLSQLTAGSRVAVPRLIPEPLVPSALPEPEIIMLAHLIGDGSFVRNQQIRYASKDEANLAAVTVAARHLGVAAVRDDYEVARCTTLRMPAPYDTARGIRGPIAGWLDSLGLLGCRSHEKFIPSVIFSLPKQQLALFLRHLWATDGSVTVSRVGTVRIYFGSTSERLARDLQNLLARFNIRARLRSAGNTYGNPQWTLDVGGVEGQRRFLEVIGVYSNRAIKVRNALVRLKSMTPAGRFDTVPGDVWQRVSEAMSCSGVGLSTLRTRIGTASRGDLNPTISPSRKRLRRIAEILGDAELEMLSTNDVFWDEIKSVESVGEQSVYDATVLGSHNFIANGINLHNSIEQDSDVVILLHREDAYERESPRAGEADLIVAKHRNGPTATVTVAFQGHYSRFVDMAPG